ncbi:helix-turn-helix transcriptional regulator [Mycobacteroides abscessus]|nr:helix-turn-helix transcriptional regulator [Mycobacteroides abscessus]
MPSNRNRYRMQRDNVGIPVVSLAVLRKSLNITLQAVCDHINDNDESEKPNRVERGTISAIENGHRGASVEMLAAIADALKIPVEAIQTDYVPINRRAPRAVAG